MSFISLFLSFIWNCLISDSNIGNICRWFKIDRRGKRLFSHQGNIILEENRLSRLLLWGLANTDRSSIWIITVHAPWTLIRRSYEIAICYIVLSMRPILVSWYCLRSATMRWESMARVKENRDLVYPYVIRAMISRHFSLLWLITANKLRSCEFVRRLPEIERNESSK